MSSGNDLQEMEVGTTQSKTAVNAGAKAGDSMDTSVAGSYEDLGGPTPENSKPDDNSNMLKTPGASLKQVKDVVNAKAKAADPMPSMKEEEAEMEVEEDQEVVAEGEEEVTSETEELVSEEEIASEGDAVVVEYNIEEDVEALLQGEELSEEFREKAKTIFEAALHSKALEIQTTLEDQYAAALEEEINEIKLALTERVDSYLEYVASEWLEENALAVESGLKTEITESFMDGMKSLFEAHYVSMPEEKYDVLENMVQKLDDMETKLNEQIERNIALNQQLSESSADRIFGQVAEGLAISQKDKFATLAESVEFESEENYRAKLETLKKSYFSEHASAPADETENLTEEADFGVETTGSSTMDAYLRALSNVTKK
jgi:hypothetical protein